ncbi:hypothetical protein BaRGS_00028768, partial [Batillaria attramentaria]
VRGMGILRDKFTNAWLAESVTGHVTGHVTPRSRVETPIPHPRPSGRRATSLLSAGECGHSSREDRFRQFTERG